MVAHDVRYGRGVGVWESVAIHGNRRTRQTFGAMNHVSVERTVLQR